MHQLVIFDCDGVLVDSERISNRILAEALSEEGLPTSTEESIERYMGRSMADCVVLIEERLGRPLPEGWVEGLRARTHAVFERELTPVPGVVGAVERVRAAGLASCVASSGSHATMRTTLSRTGLWEAFEGRIFSATEVARGKPFPDVFLHAAARMRVDPAACAVVEDSPRGVEGAVAAGMRVLGFARDSDPARLASLGATVFSDMVELPSLLGVESGASPGLEEQP